MNHLYFRHVFTSVTIATSLYFVAHFTVNLQAQEGGEASANQEAIVHDPFAIPDGDAEELIKFMDGLSDMPPPESMSLEQMLELGKKMSRAMISAADAMAERDPSDQQLMEATRYKIMALEALARNDEDAKARLARVVKASQQSDNPKVAAVGLANFLSNRVKQWAQLSKAEQAEVLLAIDKAQRDKRPEVAREGFQALVSLGVVHWGQLTDDVQRTVIDAVEKARQSDDPEEAKLGLQWFVLLKLGGWERYNDADKAALFEELFPSEKAPTVLNVKTVQAFVSRLERRDPKFAQAILDKSLPRFLEADNQEIREAASRLESISRRMNLLGNKLELSGTWLDGTELDWGSYRGKVVLVDFSAVWCGPCIAEMPNILAMYRAYHDKGFDVVGVSLDDSAENARKFAEDTNIPWGSLFSTEEKNRGFDHPMAVHYAISSVPTAILVDQEGHVIHLNARGEILEQQLQKLLGDPVDSGENESPAAEKPPRKLPVALRGSIENFDGENAKLYLIYSQPGLKESRNVIEIDDQGNFAYDFTSNLPLDAKILVKPTYANLDFVYHPGDTIKLTFDANKERIDLMRSVAFRGDRAKTNNQIIAFQTLRDERVLGYGAVDDPNKQTKLGREAYTALIGEVKTKQARLLEGFLQQPGLTAEAKIWASLFAYETYFYYSDYYSFDNEVDDAYYDYNDTISPLSQDKLVCWGLIKRCVNIHLRRTKGQQHSSGVFKEVSDAASRDALFIKAVQASTPDKLLAQLTIAQYYAHYLSIREIEGYEGNQELISGTITEPCVYQNLHYNYLEAKAYLENPGDYSDLVLRMVEDSPVEETFKQIMADNKGKVIYVDFWSTGCAPCLKAMPASKKMAAKLSEKDVAFVYICLDSEEILWKKLSADFDIPGGKHYLMNEEQSEFLRDTMKVNGIPFFFLIDKQGQIVEQGNHLHPGKDRTEEKILGLVGQH